LWFVERKGQCADAEGFAKGVPNASAVFGFNPGFRDCGGGGNPLPVPPKFPLLSHNTKSTDITVTAPP
jgi:hypothetical protein